MSLITLTDLPGTNALAIARRVATRLGIPLIDKDWVYDRFLVPYLSDHEMHLINESPRALLEDFEPGLPRVDYLRRELLAWAAFHNAVCLGFASALLLGEHPFALHVNVRAPLDLCAERVAREQAISLKEATRIVDLVNRQQKRYLRIVHEADATNQMLYHLRPAI
ncbi:MAG: cytidylate kinase family protein [Bacillota bacterium]|nr:cytidylate kinase family protein [Bacillota bacterium]